MNEISDIPWRVIQAALLLVVLQHLVRVLVAGGPV